MSGSNSVTRLFVGHLSSQTTIRDLEDTFGRYGRVCHVDLKIKGYAFVDFINFLDATSAIHHLNGSELNGRRMIVEFAAARVEARCTSCGLYGHLAEECKGCYHCGERGHYGRFCKNAKKNIRSSSPSLGPSHDRQRRSYSRSRIPPKRDPARESLSPSRSRGQRHRGRRRSYSPSRTPPKGDRRRERLSPPRSRASSPTGRRQSYSRSRTPPIRDLGDEYDRFESRNHDSQGWLDPRSGRCFRCGLHGHEAWDCKENKCFLCGEMGHIKKNCTKIFKSIRRERRSPSPTRGQLSRRRQSYSQSRSPQKRDLRPECDRHVPRNTRQTRSPPPRARDRSSNTGVRIGSPAQGLFNSSSILVNIDLNELPADRSGSPDPGLVDSP